MQCDFFALCNKIVLILFVNIPIVQFLGILKVDCDMLIKHPRALKKHLLFGPGTDSLQHTTISSLKYPTRACAAGFSLIDINININK